MPAIPPAVRALVAAAPAFGFSGSRAPIPPASLAALRALARVVPSSAPVAIGDASGIDTAARALFPAYVPFDAAARVPSILAARSSACVAWVAARAGLWCSFPARPAPAGLLPSSSPSRAFAGLGSGSWASLALAVGVGVPCLVFLPATLVAPAPFQLVLLEGGWFSHQPAAVQSLLF